MADYDGKSLAELEALSADLSNQRDALSVQHKAVQKALDAARAEEAAKAQVEGMSDTDRAAMAKVIAAFPIESGEAFGKPGQ